MTAKEYLEQARFIDQEINNKLALLALVKEEPVPITVQNDGMPRAETMCTDGVSGTVAWSVDYENEIKKMVDGLRQLKQEIVRSINALKKPEHRLVLEERYLLYKPWREIAKNLGCNIRQAHRHHGAALKEFKVPH